MPKLNRTQQKTIFAVVCVFVSVGVLFKSKAAVTDESQAFASGKSETVVIESERGIGRMSLTRPEDGWPSVMLFDVRTRGLESFVVSDSRVRLEISVNSSSHQVSYHAEVAEGEDGRVREAVADDKPAFQVTRRVAADDTEKTLGFRVEMPTDWISSQSRVVEIQWIDFYR